jgi:hypothetical protein
LSSITPELNPAVAAAKELNIGCILNGIGKTVVLSNRACKDKKGKSK